jgi:hypothetical protein
VNRLLLLGAISFFATASIARGQVSPTAVAVDSIALNTVTDYSIKSGKLALASAANPGKVYLPDGTYTNEAGTIIVILGGKITRVQGSEGDLTEISAVRVNRFRYVMLTPSTNALNTVSEIQLPSGEFKSGDGAATITIVSARPIRFTLTGSAPAK